MLRLWVKEIEVEEVMRSGEDGEQRRRALFHLALLSETMQPAWTTENPTKPAWYWCRSKRDRYQVIELIEWNNELRTIGVSPSMYAHLETHRVPYEPEAEWAGLLEPPA